MCGINHLVGIDLLNDDKDKATLSNLTIIERDALALFRQRYNEYAPPIYYECGNDDFDKQDDESEEEKKEASSSSCILRIDTNSMSKQREPKYEISNHDLPESGWRPVDDYTLYRYMNADRNKNDGTFDIDTSCRRLLDALQFRKDHDCDIIVHNVIHHTIPSTVQQCLTYKSGIYAGRDYNHRPVVFERLGHFLGSGHAQKCSDDEWITAYLYVLEMHFAKMRESSQEHKIPVQKIMYYADFAGIVSSIMSGEIWKAINLMRKIVNTVEKHYPEIVECITLFNVPFIMSSSFNVVRAFLDPVTAEKIGIHSGVPLENFKEVMSEHVIPAEYGGMNEMDFPSMSA